MLMYTNHKLKAPGVSTRGSCTIFYFDADSVAPIRRHSGSSIVVRTLLYSYGQIRYDVVGMTCFDVFLIYHDLYP